MTNQETVTTLMVVEENISCDDCLYYSQMEDCPTDDNCIVAKAIWKAINALSAIEGIKAEIEQEMSNAGTIDYLNGLNMALMIINEKYISGAESEG